MSAHQLLEFAENQRIEAMLDIDSKQQGQLGQFFTPGAAAEFIASMPQIPMQQTYRVLDPGAGSGILSAALIERILSINPDASIELIAVERDPLMIPHLEQTLRQARDIAPHRISTAIEHADFILDSVGLYPTIDIADSIDIAILNPPYGKLPATSEHRKAMKAFGTDAPNLYAAFLALTTATLKPGGQLVAITPRSFCNGPYFGEFRKSFLNAVSLDHIHVFDSRASVFSDTGVLQENVVFTVTRSGKKQTVTLSSSQDHLNETISRTLPYDSVVYPDDPHRFIRLATNEADTAVAEQVLSQPCTLADLGVQVSTGKVVDFRSRDALHDKATDEGQPLIYPGNLRHGIVEWPQEIHKPQWFKPQDAKQTSMLLPEGWYTVVKRFSSKEEKRRIVAAVWSPERTPGSVAFENHLNVFHIRGEGLDQHLAQGIANWLNSDVIDRFFRTFSGHTQVNATDLKTLRFPTLEQLKNLGHYPDSLEEIIGHDSQEGLAA